MVMELFLTPFLEGPDQVVAVVVWTILKVSMLVVFVALRLLVRLPVMLVEILVFWAVVVVSVVRMLAMNRLMEHPDRAVKVARVFLTALILVIIVVVLLSV